MRLNRVFVVKALCPLANNLVPMAKLDLLAKKPSPLASENGQLIRNLSIDVGVRVTSLLRSKLFSGTADALTVCAPRNRPFS